MEIEEAKKELVKRLFAHVASKIGKKGKNPCSDYIAKVLFVNTHSNKTYTRYYERYIDEQYTEGGVINLPTLDLMAQYFGCESFAQYAANLRMQNETSSSSGTADNNKESKGDALGAEGERRLRYINEGSLPNVLSAKNQG